MIPLEATVLPMNGMDRTVNGLSVAGIRRAMKCPFCNTEVPATQPFNFCPTCGQTLPSDEGKGHFS